MMMLHRSLTQVLYLISTIFIITAGIGCIALYVQLQHELMHTMHEKIVLTGRLETSQTKLQALEIELAKTSDKKQLRVRAKNLGLKPVQAHQIRR